MELLYAMWDNLIIRTALFGWFVAQFLKVVVDICKSGTFDIKRFIGGSGGMPSSHTSLVVSTCIAVLEREGPYSSTFALSVVLAGVVMYDAIGVRRAAGEHARMINALVDEWDWSNPALMGTRLKELLGHTPLEVCAGAVVGVIVGLVMNPPF